MRQPAAKEREISYCVRVKSVKPSTTTKEDRGDGERGRGGDFAAVRESLVSPSPLLRLSSLTILSATTRPGQTRTGPRRRTGRVRPAPFDRPRRYPGIVVFVSCGGGPPQASRNLGPDFQPFQVADKVANQVDQPRGLGDGPKVPRRPSGRLPRAMICRTSSRFIRPVTVRTGSAATARSTSSAKSQTSSRSGRSSRAACRPRNFGAADLLRPPATSAPARAPPQKRRRRSASRNRPSNSRVFHFAGPQRMVMGLDITSAHSTDFLMAVDCPVVVRIVSRVRACGKGDGG